MKILLTAALIIGGLSTTAFASENYEYGWMTGQIAGTSIIGANVVRKPAFQGEKDEQVQAMDKAKTALEKDYCQDSNSQFVADPGLIMYDKGINEWIVGGVCK